MRVASPQILFLLTLPCLAATPVRKHIPTHALVAAHTFTSSYGKPTTHAVLHTAAHAVTKSHAAVRESVEPQHTHTPAHHDSPSSGMDSERAAQIQTALIKAGYLTGTPTGTWDAESIAAMQKLQEDNGWQTKIVPVARALIKLGLGPRPDTPTTPQQ